MQRSLPIPGLKYEFPDLDRKMAYELSTQAKGCGGCNTSDIVKKYAKLADARRVALRGKTLEQ